jgi:hypothetical protein
VIFAFVRISTHPRIFTEPLSVSEASTIRQIWTSQVCGSAFHQSASLIHRSHFPPEDRRHHAARALPIML